MFITLTSVSFKLNTDWTLSYRWRQQGSISSLMQMSQYGAGKLTISKLIRKWFSKYIWVYLKGLKWDLGSACFYFTTRVRFGLWYLSVKYKATNSRKLSQLRSRTESPRKDIDKPTKLQHNIHNSGYYMSFRCLKAEFVTVTQSDNCFICSLSVCQAKISCFWHECDIDPIA